MTELGHKDYYGDGSVFDGCESLKSIQIPDSCTRINSNVFRFSGLESVILPKNLKELRRGAFRGNNSLMNIELPAGFIGSSPLDIYPFEDCKKLMEIAARAGFKSTKTALVGGNGELTDFLEDEYDSYDEGGGEIKSGEGIIR